MTDTPNEGAQVETEEAALAEGVSGVELWLKQIKAADQEEKDWRDSAKSAIEVYEAGENCKVAFNILHSNTETITPAIYNSTPIPDVRRRFGDKDPLAKEGADIIERAISFSVDQYEFDETMEAAIRDAIVPGRGIARIKYEPQTTQDNGVEDIGYQQVVCKHVEWDSFRRGPAKKWEDVPWVAFLHHLDKEEVVRLIQASGQPLDISQIKFDGPSGDDEQGDKRGDPEGIFKTTPVWEIWDKKRRLVIFIAEGFKDAPLLVQPDPLGFPGFFPLPCPIQQIRRLGSLTPVVPYDVYKTLAEHLDVMTKRRANLIKQLRVRGLIDAKLSADFEKLRTCEDGQYEAASDVEAIMAMGGELEKAIAHWPLEPTVKAIQELNIQIEATKQQIHEIMGLADIMRGASDANETAKAQQIKAQWGALRIQRLQKEVARFARDLFRLKAALICTKFTPENLSVMTGIQVQPEVYQLLQSDAMRAYRIDIESDSTIRSDLTRSQEQMNLFLQGSGQFAQAMGGIAMQAPQALPAIVNVYTAFARHFKLGKQAEDSLETMSKLAEDAAKQPSPPNPEKQKLEMEMQAKQAESQMKLQGMQAETQARMQLMQAEFAMKQKELELKERELAMKEREMMLTMQFKERELVLNAQARQYDHELGMQATEQKHSMGLEALAAKTEAQKHAAKQPRARA